MPFSEKALSQSKTGVFKNFETHGQRHQCTLHIALHSRRKCWHKTACFSNLGKGQLAMSLHCHHRKGHTVQASQVGSLQCYLSLLQESASTFKKSFLLDVCSDSCMKWQPLLLQGNPSEDLLQTQSSLDLPGEGGSRLSIFYNSPWERVFLHGSINGGEWRDHQFQRVSSATRYAVQLEGGLNADLCIVSI